jgi:hypothetical protein
VTEDRPQLRPGGGITTRFTGLLVGAAIGALGLGSAPAAAGGSGPERPPVSAPARLAPEPAPVAAAKAPAPTSSVQATPSSVPQVRATSTRPAAVASTAGPVTHRTPPARISTPKAPPPAVAHKVTRKVKSLALAIGRPTARLSFAMPPSQPSDSNRLLFIGGLALLILVLGDASLLALSTRVLRDQAER